MNTRTFYMKMVKIRQSKGETRISSLWQREVGRDFTRRFERAKVIPIFLLCLAIVMFLQILGFTIPPGKLVDLAIASDESSEEAAKPTSPEDQSVEIEQKWGVKILGIRQTANAFLLDFRFHVIDPEKAKSLIGRGAKPYIIDEASGLKLSVPNMPKVGSLRAKGNEPNRDYYILFSNPNGIIKKGNKVTIIADDFKVEHLVVK